MSFAVRLYPRLDAFVSYVGFLSGWLMYPLIGVTIFDVVTRRFFVLGSTYLQEAEWHLHAVIVMLALGYAYLRNRQVRIDIFRAKWSPRSQAFVELVGCILFMTPFALILIYYGTNFSLLAWTQNEVSSSAMGFGNRWAIKAFIPIGATFLLLGGLGVLLRTILFLFGPIEIREQFSEAACAAKDPTV